MGRSSLARSQSRSLHFFLRISFKMSKLLLAIIGLILVVFVSANTETDNQNTDISLQNDLLIREARETGRKDKKGKKSKAKKKKRNKSKSKKRNAEKKRKNKTKSRKGKAERKTEGSKRRNLKINKSKKRVKTKQRKNKGSGKKKRKNDKNKISKRNGSAGKHLIALGSTKKHWEVLESVW